MRGASPGRQILRYAVGLATGSALAPLVARAQSFDGTYAGTINCGVLRGMTRPLLTEFSMTVSGSRASYERRIVRPGGPTGTQPTGNYERGRGTVTPSGEVTLRGTGEGNAVVDAEYRGQFSGRGIRLVGTQRWQVRGQVDERSCQIDLALSPPKS